MSFALFQTWMKESLEYLDASVDEGRRVVLRDAVEQADTLEELGLLTLLPGLHWADPAPRPQSQMLVLLGESVALVLVVTRLVLAHPAVLARHHVLERDGTLYAVTGGFGTGQHWYPLPHGIGRCRVDDGSLEWLDDMGRIKDRKYGLLHRLVWQHGQGCVRSKDRKKQQPTEDRVVLAFETYQGDEVAVEAEVTARGLCSLRWRVTSVQHSSNSSKSSKKSQKQRWSRAQGLLPYRDCPRDYWVHDVRTSSEWFHRWKFLHPVSLNRWVKLRLCFRGDPQWHEVKGWVTGPLQEGDQPVVEESEPDRQQRLRVLTTVSEISDTSGRSMFFPFEYALERDGCQYVVRGDYKDSVVYMPNGNMNWLGTGRIYDTEQKEVGVCILEAHQLQSLDEVIGTTLQLAGFVDRRDDDTRNDWELFRP